MLSYINRDHQKATTVEVFCKLNSYKQLKMKFLIVIAAILAITYGLEQEFVDQIKAKIMKVGQECMAEVGATSEDVEEIIAKKTPSRHEGKCLLACGHKRFGVQGADGKIDEAGAIASLEKLKEADAEVYGKMKAMFEKCFGEVTNDADECVTAVNWMSCIHQAVEENGLTDLFKM